MSRGIFKRAAALSLAAMMGLHILPASVLAEYQDVSVTSPAYEDIKLLSGLGVVEGVGNGRFEPEAQVKRADFMIMLSKVLQIEATGDKSFPDVAADAYYYNDVMKAANAGIVSGREDGCFYPQAGITMQEAVKMIVTAYEKINDTVMQISEPVASRDNTLWAGGEVDKAITGNIIDEEGFSANHIINRAEAAEMLAGLFMLQTNSVQLDYKRETSIIQKQRGNIFLDTDGVPEFDVETGYPIVEYVVVDFWGNTVRHGYKKVLDGRINLKFENLDLGHYYVYLYGNDGEGIRQRLAQTTISYLKKFEAAAPDENPYGVNFHDRPAYGWDLSLMYEASLIGVRHIRGDWNWTHAEPTYKGTYTNYVKDFTDMAVKHGMTYLPCTGFRNKFYDGGSRPYTDEGRLGFANFQKAFYDFYGNREDFHLFKRMEMFNEWYQGSNLYGAPYTIHDIEYLRDLFKVSYEVMKEKYPDVILSGMTWSPQQLAYGPIEEDWTYKFISSSADYIDELTIHAYPTHKREYEPLEFDEEGYLKDIPEALVEEGLEAVADTVNNYTSKEFGTTLPWGVTETGYHTVDNYTERLQGYMYPRLLTSYIHHGAQYIYTYDFLCDGNDEKSAEDNYGIINALLSKWGSYTGRPSYVSYGVNARMINDKKSKGRELRDNIYCYDFAKGADSIKIFNSALHKDQVIALYTNDKIQITDMMGAAKEYTPYNGKVYITVSEDMSYVKGNITKWEVVEGISFEEKESPVLGADFTLSAKDGAFDASEFTYEVNGVEYTADEIVVPASYEEGDRFVRIFAKLNGEYIGEFRKEVKMSGRYMFSAVYGLVKKDNSFVPTADVTIKNLTDDSLRINALAMTINGEQRRIEINRNLGAKEEMKYTIELEDCSLYKEYEFSFRVVEGGKISKYLDGEGKNMYAPLSRKTMVIDGVIDSDIDTLYTMDFEGLYKLWQNGQPLWSGPSDLSGQAWVSYDDENLYIAVSVNDDVHLANKSGDMSYSQDCIQVGLYHEKYEDAVGLNDASVKAMDGNHEISFYLAGGTTPKLYRYRTATPFDDYEKWENVNYEIVRDESKKTTVYEIAFPWSELGVTPAETNSYGVEIVVQDSDEADRTNAYYLNDTAIHSGKNRYNILQYSLVK